MFTKGNQILQMLMGFYVCVVVFGGVFFGGGFFFLYLFFLLLCMYVYRYGTVT